jgi:hypothetical protein
MKNVKREFGSRVVALPSLYSSDWGVEPGTVGTITGLGFLPGLYNVRWDDGTESESVADTVLGLATEEDEDAYYKRMEAEDRRSHPVFGW